MISNRAGHSPQSTYRLEIDVQHTYQDPPHPSLSQILAGVSALDVWEVCFANHFAISGDIHSSSVTVRVAAVSLYSLMIDTNIETSRALLGQIIYSKISLFWTISGAERRDDNNVKCCLAD